MRICLLSGRFPPDMSGMGDYTYFLANALARIDNEVHVLTAAGELDEVLYPLVGGVRVHRIMRTWGMRGLPHILRTVRDMDYDVIVVQYTPHAFDRRGITFSVNLLPALLRVTTQTRVIVNFHELYIPFDLSAKHVLGALWQRAMAFLIAAHSHGLTAISTEWPRRLRQVGVWRPIQVIPVGSNIPRAEISADEREAVRAQFGVDPNTLLVGCFGSAGPHRDKELLLSAVRELKRERAVKLAWLGNSGLRTAERLENAGMIIWTGPLPHPEMSRIMTACDVFVLPFTDGVSTKRGTLAAALMHGLPVLTTRGERSDDIFVHDENVYLVPLGDNEAFAQGLLDLACRPELRARLARGARALHSARFAWEVIAQQVASSMVDGSRS